MTGVSGSKAHLDLRFPELAPLLWVAASIIPRSTVASIRQQRGGASLLRKVAVVMVLSPVRRGWSAGAPG